MDHVSEQHEHEHGRDAAPGDLRLVEEFLNTRDVEDGIEAFETPAALSQWLAAHGLAAAGAGFDDDERRHAIAVREALRAVLLHHNGVELDPSAEPTLNAAARRATMHVVFDDGDARLAPAGRGIDEALARLFAIMARAQAEGTWMRLKACPWDTCRWAFYDHSRNHSRTWCSMEVCGNRAKARAYRERARRS